jgi:hypothetical protein
MGQGSSSIKGLRENYGIKAFSCQKSCVIHIGTQVCRKSKMTEKCGFAGKREPPLPLKWTKRYLFRARKKASQSSTDQIIRIARQFPLSLEATHPASLFNGFNKTKHADVKVINFEDEGVAERIFTGKEYSENNVQSMSHEAFWQLAGLSG